MSRILLAALLGLAMATPGCLGLFGGDEDDDAGPTSVSENLSEENLAQIEEAASGLFKNWTFASQGLLEPVVSWLNGTVTAGAEQGIEDRNDRSGNDYNTQIVAHDLSSLAPPLQPVELRIKLFYFGKLGSSADLDIHVDVPGTTTSWAGDSSDEFDWKVSVQEITVNTMRLPGAPFEAGVQIANQRVLTEPLQYALKVEAFYERGVIAPQVPVGITVPPGASSLILSSAKAGGEEHVRGLILIIDPDDELVETVAYNDIGLATESRLIPITKPGEYVVYAYNLTGGFIRLSTDVPLPADIRSARLLERVETPSVDLSQPAPGLVARDYGAPTPSAGGQDVSFTVEGAFPLEIIATIGAASGPDVRGASEVTISSSKGPVYRLARVLQYEDDRGTLGHSRDEMNIEITYANLAKGAYTMHIVNDGPSEIGHVVVTYKR